MRQLTFSILLRHITFSFTFIYLVWPSKFNRWQTTGKGKVKCTLVQALWLCTGCTAQKGSWGITLLFLDHGTRRGWGVSVTPQPLFTHGKEPVSIVQEAGWAPGPVWRGAENLAPPANDPRTVQPVASRYTNWANQSTQTTGHSLNIINLEKWTVQDICTWPSTYAWDKQQMDSDRLQQRIGSGCLTATEVTIDRHAGKELSIPQPDWHETFVTAVSWNTKFFSTLNHMMVYCVLHFVLKWQKHFCQQWLLIPCCVQW